MPPVSGREQGPTTMTTSSAAAAPLTLQALDNPAVLDNPYPLYRRLRETSPVLWDPVRHHWTVTRHQEVTQALRSPALHAVPRRLGPRTPPPCACSTAPCSTPIRPSTPAAVASSPKPSPRA
uniref:cytochrome P450 n=1 Tax=Streptomyces rimosus TaxID=1927 RepID=UPI0021758C71|nr:cytochrome P450 [Streptomyces rimosus]